MTPYQVLVDVLDRLRQEAPVEYKSYYPDPSNIDSLNGARAKAYLHLFLKARFGLLEFADRERLITEGADDGGIDAYYIDSENRVIYFLQSKFRTTEQNFEEKVIEPEELLMMDVARIMEGETNAETGRDYNSKVKQMVRTIRDINDIGRYSSRVVILANAKGVTARKLRELTGGFQSELIDHKTCFRTLLFPLVSGTYYNADLLHLSLSLSDKSAGAKISYTVLTECTKCEITVVFVPTLEIARAMFKYRNSILQYNPRSYLGHDGRSVNAEIRKSIEARATNEFALFNNGITILSDETFLNERIGQKDRAQLVLTNPQIINGGQTAYTLSIIYRENLEKNLESVFGGKEVLVKIITFESSDTLPEEKKLKLIADISLATNQQTAVTNADRRADEKAMKDLQSRMFDTNGLFLERKRGEFEDGVREGYIKAGDVLDRSLFMRAVLTVQGKLSQATKKRQWTKINYDSLLTSNDEILRKYAFASLLLQKLSKPVSGNRPGMKAAILARVYFATVLRCSPGMSLRQRDEAVNRTLTELGSLWKEFKNTVLPDKVNDIFGDWQAKDPSRHFLQYVGSEEFARDCLAFKELKAKASYDPT